MSRARLAAVAAAAALFLAAALYNGYPLVFYDSGDYIAMSFTFEPLIYRTIPYALFLAATHFGASLWLPAAVQAVITAWLLAEAFAVFAPSARPSAFVATAAMLAVATALPWFAGQLMPDAFAAPLALGVAILLFAPADWPVWRRGLVAALTFIAAASHLSHLAVAIVLLVLAVLFRPLLRARWPAAMPRLGLAAAVIAATAAAVPAANLALTGRLYVSEAGPVFLLARMAQDGLLQRYLARNCPAAGYALCGFQDQLPQRANELLWARDSALVELGGWYGLKGEAGRIIFDSLRQDPLGHLAAALRHTARQAVTLRTGEGLYNQWQTTRDMVARHFPHELAAYDAARQQWDRVDYDGVNLLHVPVALAAAAALPVAVAARARHRRASALLAAAVLAAFLANAAVCGVLSGPNDRYQSRIAWLPLAALAVVLADRASGQNTSRWSRLLGRSTQGGQTIRKP